jgi:hypothetical protein
VFDFPNPVNEKAARVVAGCVAALAAAALFTGAYWLVAIIALGFALRVASGPRFSPLGLFATKVAAPRLGEPKLVAGPPKRFAQALGLAMSTTAALAALAFDATGVADVLLAALIVAATLESVFALCLGCQVFAGLMRLGVIPQSVCAECADIWAREPARS